jgi:hypothetical protein
MADRPIPLQGKKKGDINLDGFTVDAKGLEGKPFSIELHHRKRRCWFIQCESEEQKKEWMDVFSLCCRFATRAFSTISLLGCSPSSCADGECAQARPPTAIP